jgi:transposase
MKKKRRGRTRALSDEQVQDVDEMYYDGGWTARAIAHFFRTTESTIGTALNRVRAYKNTPRRKR